MRRKNAIKNPIYNLQISNLWANLGLKEKLYILFKKIFLFCQRLGFHITPNHFYFPIPDTRTLKDKLWLRQSKLVGIDINENKQLELLTLFSSKFENEYNNFPMHKTQIPHQYYVNNGNFRSVDGEILYCMMRYFKPKKIIEIGSGFSTYLSAQAILKNKKEDNSYKCKLIAIEPYPNNILKKGFPGLSKLISKRVQDIPLSFFKKLNENDILFIDSSHILKIGSDVEYEFLEILPRLNKGVLIHIHDIFLPSQYPKEWVLNLFRFYTEQYLLHALLIFNNNFDILWAGRYMHLNHFNKLEIAFNSYKRDRTQLEKADFSSFKRNHKDWPIEWPTSFWMKKEK